MVGSGYAYCASVISEFQRYASIYVPMTSWLLVVGSSVVGLLASGMSRRWTRGEAVAVVLFRFRAPNSWLCVRSFLLAASLPLLTQVLFNYFWFGGVSFVVLALSYAVALIASIAVLRTLADLSVLTLRADRVTLWTISYSSTVQSLAAAGEREIRVTFDHGGSESFWLPEVLFGTKPEQAGAQLLGIESAVNVVLGAGAKEI